MKKIFLLSLLSVLLLSAYSQTSIGQNLEEITKFSILKNQDSDGDGDGIDRAGRRWWFLYRTVTREYLPGGGVQITCLGYGLRICWIPIWNFFNGERGLPTEILDASCSDLMSESETRATNGEFKGSITKKIAIQNGDASNKENYYIVKLDFNYSAENPSNGYAEITIYKTSSLGLK